VVGDKKGRNGWWKWVVEMGGGLCGGFGGWVDGWMGGWMADFEFLVVD
jgi:hypothetical protein